MCVYILYMCVYISVWYTIHIVLRNVYNLFILAIVCDGKIMIISVLVFIDDGLRIEGLHEVTQPVMECVTPSLVHLSLLHPAFLYKCSPGPLDYSLDLTHGINNLSGSFSNSVIPECREYRRRVVVPGRTAGFHTDWLCIVTEQVKLCFSVEVYQLTHIWPLIIHCWEDLLKN